MVFTAAPKLLWLFLAGSLLLYVGSTPESTVRDFVRYANVQDFENAARLVRGGKPGEDYTVVKRLTRGFRFTIGSIKTQVNGSRATATLTLTLIDSQRRSSTEKEELSLTKVGGEWLIVPPKDFELGKGMISSMAGMTTNPSDVVKNAKEAAKRVACVSNLKQLATGMMILLTDTNDVFKLTTSNAQAVLRPYLKNDKLWFCPSGSTRVPAYSFNGKLAGQDLSLVRDPAKTVMLYEGSNGKLDFRHSKVAAVAFVDGHVKVFTQAEAAKLRWNP